MPIDWEASGYGVIRGVAVRVATAPLDAVKTRLLASPDEKVMVAARGKLFRGLIPQLIRDGVSQAWRWPVIIGVPKALEEWSPWKAQLGAAVVISTADAVLTPIERWRVRRIAGGEGGGLYSGVGRYWTKQFGLWSIFLLGQKWGRDHFRDESGKVSVGDQMRVAAGISVAAASLTAPLEFYHIQKQKGGIESKTVKSSMRTIPLTLAALLIHNLASVAILERLEP